MRELLTVWGIACAMTACAGTELNWREDTYEPEPPMLYASLAGAKATASGQFGGNGPDRVIDGNTDTWRHWGCEQLPASVTIELARAQKLTQGHIWFFYGDGRTYKFYIERSMDGKDWTKVADWTKNEKGSTAEGFQIPFEPAGEGKFVRITVTDSSKRANGAHIVEFNLAGQTAARGLHGRVAKTERIDADNAMGDESVDIWKATAWKNERVYGQFVLWSGDKFPQMRLEASELTGPGTIPAEAVRAQFVRYVLAGGKAVGDCIDDAKTVDLPAGGYRPVWLTVTVPEGARPGVYRGTLTVTACGRAEKRFPLELTVLGAALPSPKDWTFFLDIWQHPWAVARYHHVEPFSAAHYALLEPLYRELASAGQKVITTTVTDLPWNHQNFDAYHTMIKHLKQSDGSWKFDYSIFDEYVAFCKKCGLGPHIHCYSMAPWGNIVYYIDAATGDQVAFTAKPGTPEHETFWGPFLKDFQRHLEKKGWVNDTYMAMDERGIEEMRSTQDCIRKFAPRLKIAMPGNRPPSQLQEIELSNYCHVLSAVNADFVKESQARHAKGLITTFYVCCGPARPNTFSFSPTAEQVWLPCYAEAKHLDGFLRWAFVNWPRDPLYDTSFGSWPAGDTFFLYPGARLSVRWAMLRDGIEEAEKIRVLRASGKDVKALEGILSTYDFGAATKMNDAELADLVGKTRAAIEAAAAQL